MTKAACALVVFALMTTAVSALDFRFLNLDFQLEKQKLKLSYDYENYVGLDGSEILTPGIKAAYMMKGAASAGQHFLLNFNLQAGMKTNIHTQFNVGDLSRFTWTNRLSVAANVPVNRFYVGSTFYLRNKWLSEVPLQDQFVDIFGGEGYREMTGGIQAGFSPDPTWDVSGSVQKSTLRYQQFELSNSDWTGTSVQVSHRIKSIKVTGGYRYRDIHYDRPVITASTDTFGITSDLQHDHFWELGGNVEFVHGVYFSSGYFYQQNNSNSPNFTYSNNRIAVLVGTDLGQDFHLQAYGVLTRQDYATEDSPLDLPLLLDESENTMAASLVKTLNKTSEIEFGFERYTNYSSFHALNTAKNIFYAAYNFRF